MNRMNRRLLLALAVAGCADLPRDPDDTLDRVRDARTIHVTIVDDAPAARAYLARLARDTGARVRAADGSLEPALLALERGEVDLVVARLDHRTPWSARVAVGPHIAPADPALRAVAAPGENGWLMRLHRSAP